MKDLSSHRAQLLCPDSASLLAYENAMQQALQAVKTWLQDEKMYAGGSIKSLRNKIHFLPSAQGMGLENALKRAIDLFLNNSLKVHHPHSLAHLHCPTLVPSQIAEVLINASNQSMDSWDQSPAASLMEVQLIEWLREKAGYGKGDAGVFTSGGTQSNLMGVLLARDACIAKHWQKDGKAWSVQQEGIPADALHKVKVLCSENAHFSVQKNMAMMGMGFQAVIAVPCNATAQMDIDALANIMQTQKAQGNIIACVVATAGTTDAGAIDDLRAISQLCQQQGAWLHVDAAWGGAVLLSKRYRHLLNGIEQADSITLDFHKHYFQSISCGAFLLKEAANFRLMHYEAEYLNSAYDEAYGVPNLVAKSLQTTRRFDALKLWLSLEAIGEELYADMIDHGIDLAQEVAEYIQQSEELSLLLMPSFASVLFRVVPKDYPSQYLDALNQNIADELFAQGEANLGVTKVGNLQALKMTLLNPIVSLEAVKKLLRQVQTQAQAIKEAIANGNYRPPIA